MKTLVKICGITNIYDAKQAVKAGADALGFVFFRKSKRYISLESAKKICMSVPGSVLKIGVFVDEDPENLDEVFVDGFLDFFQLHGNEDDEYCMKYPGKIIKAFRIKKKSDLKSISNYNSTDFWLFDTAVDGLAGGTGKTFDWEFIKGISEERLIVLAGGLNSENVSRAIKVVRPYMVDVSSGVETVPGQKNPLLVKKFVNSCRIADKMVSNEK